MGRLNGDAAWIEHPVRRSAGPDCGFAHALPQEGLTRLFLWEQQERGEDKEM